MTIQEVIANLENIKPNQYDEGSKLIWLNEIENRVYQVMIARKGSENILPPVIDEESDYDEDMLLPDAFANIYTYYLAAMINYSNGETARYNNSMIMFDNAWSEYENYWYRTHPQVSDGKFRK